MGLHPQLVGEGRSQGSPAVISLANPTPAARVVFPEPKCDTVLSRAEMRAAWCEGLLPQGSFCTRAFPSPPRAAPFDSVDSFSRHFWNPHPVPGIVLGVGETAVKEGEALGEGYGVFGKTQETGGCGDGD